MLTWTVYEGQEGRGLLARTFLPAPACQGAAHSEPEPRERGQDQGGGEGGASSWIWGRPWATPILLHSPASLRFIFNQSNIHLFRAIYALISCLVTKDLSYFGQVNESLCQFSNP